MTRPLLDAKKYSAAALVRLAAFHPQVIATVVRAIEESPVVVIGMRGNPHVKRARKALADASIRFEYIEYGSYASGWKQRLAIKLWSGWPTFPQVFVRGVLIGGADQASAALADGSLKAMVGAE